MLHYLGNSSLLMKALGPSIICGINTSLDEESDLQDEQQTRLNGILDIIKKLNIELLVGPICCCVSMSMQLICALI